MCLHTFSKFHILVYIYIYRCEIVAGIRYCPNDFGFKKKQFDIYFKFGLILR